MSPFLALLLSSVVSTSAFAAVKTVSFSALKTDAIQAKNLLEGTGDDCSFNVSPTTTGIRLSIDSTDGKVFVHFPKSEQVTLNEKLESDGSYVRTYSAKGIGTFTLTHVDDAYDMVELHSELVSRSGACSVNY